MDKPFKTISEQISILENRGLAVGPQAHIVLEREGYYPVINGYKDPFVKTGSDRFIDGVSFNDIYRLFVFDRKLRMAMFSYFAKAEATFKTVCSYAFAERHQDDGSAYLKHDSYSEEAWCQEGIENLIDDFDKIIGYQEDGNLRTKKQYIVHYVTRHDCVPIWVLANYLSLGQIFKFYCFQKESVRNEIAKSFSNLYEESHKNRLKITHRRLRLAYDHIKDFRNICAHDERLYCAKVSPSKDTNLLGVLGDLAIVMTSDDTTNMIKDVMQLMLELNSEIDPFYSAKVFQAMGISDLMTLVAIAEQ